MSDQFVPTGAQGQIVEVMPETSQKPNQEALAQQEYAKVLQDNRVMQIMQYTGTLYQLSSVTAIENQTQYDQVIDAFDSSKRLLNLIEERRVEIVGFPTKVVRLINSLFKQLRENVETVKAHYSALIEAKKQFDQQQYALGQQAGAEAEPEAKPTGEPGVSTVEFDTPTESAPGNVVQSARGAKTHSRTDLDIEVTDIVAFLKVVTSKNKRYAPFHEAVEDLVEIKVGPLKKLIKKHKRRSLPGLKIGQTSKTV